MTWFVTQPLGRRTWVLPLPAPRLRRPAALRRAVAGRTVLITGASSGVGRAAAGQLGRAGARVLLVARRRNALEEAAGELREADADAGVYPADLSRPAEVDRLLEELREGGEAVDVLVNNAARSIRRAVSVSVGRPHDYERTMQLNYQAPVRLTLGLLPGMRERGRGHVINVSSLGVQLGTPRFSAYLASKAALDAFTRVSTAELAADGIALTTVHLPLVRTAMIEPTHRYDAAPALSAAEAAHWICEAVRVRPRSVDVPLGPVGEVAFVLAPALMERAMEQAFRAFGEAGDRAR